MTVWIKQSTARTIPVGPIVDSIDGATAETSLTISQGDIRLSKNGGAFAQTANATGAAHLENGWYGVPLDTTDTDTLGELVINIAESGGLQAWVRCMVVPANVWDSMFGADYLQVETVCDIDGYTLEDALKLCLAALAGKISGAATATNTIRAADDSKARITATVDSDGNRTAITLDATG